MKAVGNKAVTGKRSEQSERNAVVGIEEEQMAVSSAAVFRSVHILFN